MISIFLEFGIFAVFLCTPFLSLDIIILMQKCIRFLLPGHMAHVGIWAWDRRSVLRSSFIIFASALDQFPSWVDSWPC